MDQNIREQLTSWPDSRGAPPIRNPSSRSMSAAPGPGTGTLPGYKQHGQTNTSGYLTPSCPYSVRIMTLKLTIMIVILQCIYEVCFLILRQYKKVQLKCFKAVAVRGADRWAETCYPHWSLMIAPSPLCRTYLSSVGFARSPSVPPRAKLSPAAPWWSLAVGGLSDSRPQISRLWLENNKHIVFVRSSIANCYANPGYAKPQHLQFGLAR